MSSGATVEPDRQIHLILENERNQASYLRRTAQCRPRTYNAQWNDDIHHALHVLITGEKDGYYFDYAERPLDQLGRCLVEWFRISRRCFTLPEWRDAWRTYERTAADCFCFVSAESRSDRKSCVRGEDRYSCGSRARFAPRWRFFCWLLLHPCFSWAKSSERKRRFFFSAILKRIWLPLLLLAEEMSSRASQGSTIPRRAKAFRIQTPNQLLRLLDWIGTTLNNRPIRIGCDFIASY